MTTKVLEIRDAGTFIPVLAMRLKGQNMTQTYYVHFRCGHPGDGSSIVLMRLDDLKSTNDPREWASLVGGTRTMPVAHNHILAHFDELIDGDVVDVEFILGETTTPKKSEREAR